MALLYMTGCGDSGKGAYSGGEQALSKGDFEGAYILFQQAREAGGRSKWGARALLKLAKLERVIKHEPQKALKYCEALKSGEFPSKYRYKAVLLEAEIEAKDLKHPLKGVELLESVDPPSLLKEKWDRRLVEYAILARNLDKATAVADRLLATKKGIENLKYTLMLAELFRCGGFGEKAQKLYERVITEGDKNLVLRARFGLASLMEDQDRLEEALKILKELYREGYRRRLVKVRIKHVERRIKEENR
jgi:tetratricopeptide (TPR) repeat protein